MKRYFAVLDCNGYGPSVAHDENVDGDWVLYEDVEVVLDEALNIIEALVSEEPCHFDHHGDCQEHGWFNLRVNNEKCPHEEARELLARVRGGKNEANN